MRKLYNERKRNEKELSQNTHRQFKHHVISGINKTRQKSKNSYMSPEYQPPTLKTAKIELTIWRAFQSVAVCEAL